MSYRRRTNIYGSSYNTGTTKVSIYWSQKSSAYAIKFNDTRHWNEMQIFIQYLKNIAYGERDYDPDNKIWYLMEKHIEPFLEMLRMIPQHFELDYQEKPVGSPTSQFVSVDVYLDRFKALTNTDIRTATDYNIAKKLYRRAVMENHPDRGGDSKKMSEINETWSQLELLHFKIRKEPEYA